MQGLLDLFKQGYQNSGLQELGNSIANQPKMYDPHANARALMGSTPMQQQPIDMYPTQPPSLIADTPQDPNIPVANPTFTQQSPWTEATISNAPQSPWGSQQQQGLINDGNNVNLGQTSETWGSGYTGTPTESFKPINTTGSPDYGVNVNKPEYVTPTDNTDYSASTTPFVDKYGWSENSNGAHIVGELKEWAKENPSNLGTNMTDAEKAEFIQKREEAMARLPWYLGGTGGK